MNKTIAAASVAAALLFATDASARCSPGQIAGKWHIDLQNNFASWTREPATITAAGVLSGSLDVKDGLNLFFDIRSISPIKVDANCNVTGEFGIFYGAGVPLRSYAFRSKMSTDGTRFGKRAIVWPNYDNAPIDDRNIVVEFERFVP